MSKLLRILDDVAMVDITSEEAIEEIRKLMLSEEEIAKKIHSFDAITSDEEKLNRLWDKILEENRKKYYRKLAKSMFKEYEKKMFGDK